MPAYDYECANGHIVEMSRKMEERDLPLYCPLCNRYDGTKNMMKRLMTAGMAVIWQGNFHDPSMQKQDLDGMGSTW